MGVLIPVDIDANYDEDRQLLSKLNQHLELFYDKEADKVLFCIDFAEDDHYATIGIDLAELLEAIGKVKQLP